MTTKADQKIEDRLNGDAENYIRDAGLFGIPWAIEEHHLHDLNYALLEEWTRGKLTKDITFDDRGILHNPSNGIRWAEDMLEAFLSERQRILDENTQLKKEKEHYKTALNIYRAQNNNNETIKKLISKVMEK